LNNGASIQVGAGEFRAAAISGQGQLNVQAGASARLTGGAGTASRLTALTLDPAAKLDIGSSALILDYSDASPLPAMLAQIKSARAGNWTGNGIGSSTAASNGNTAIGIGEAADIFHLSAGQTANFQGEPVDATTLLIRYTLTGDTNLDGIVSFADLVQVAQHYGATDGTWSTGDFDYNGTINFADLVALAQNYGTDLPSAASFPADFSSDLAAAFAQASLPEPSVLALVILPLASLLRRRRRT